MNTRQRATRLCLAIVATALGIAAGIAPGAVAQPADPLEALEERVASLERHRNLLFVLAGGTAIALTTGWLLLIKKAGQIGRRHMERMVERFPGAVELVVQEHEGRAALRSKSRVLVVADGLDLQARLREHGFLELRAVEPSAAGSEDFSAVDAVVFDLTDGVSPALAAGLIRSHPRDIFLVYSPVRADLPPERATFANSPITLYARLMELLEYHATRQRKR